MLAFFGAIFIDNTIVIAAIIVNSNNNVRHINKKPFSTLYNVLKTWLPFVNT